MSASKVGFDSNRLSHVGDGRGVINVDWPVRPRGGRRIGIPGRYCRLDVRVVKGTLAYGRKREAGSGSRYGTSSARIVVNGIGRAEEDFGTI